MPPLLVYRPQQAISHIHHLYTWIYTWDNRFFSECVTMLTILPTTFTFAHSSLAFWLSFSSFSHWNYHFSPHCSPLHLLLTWTKTEFDFFILNYSLQQNIKYSFSLANCEFFNAYNLEKFHLPRFLLFIAFQRILKDIKEECSG